MLTEATVVHEQGHGVPNAPGIYTDAQKEAWKPIVDAVHTKGAFFFCQLWYCGRVSHSAYNPGECLPYPALLAMHSLREIHSAVHVHSSTVQHMYTVSYCVTTC